MNTLQEFVQEEIIDSEVICADFDEDCKDVKSKVDCWLYMPDCGICPFLK